MRYGFADERVRAGHVEHILGCDERQVNEERLHVELGPDEWAYRACEVIENTLYESPGDQELCVLSFRRVVFPG